MSKAASMPSAVRRPLSFERGSLALFASLAVLIAGLVSLDTGLTGVGLFILGGLLGAVFLLFQYGFASVWRHALVRGEVMGLAAHFLLIGLCAIVFIPASALGLSAAGTVAPVTISLFVGAFIFWPRHAACKWLRIWRVVQLWERFRPDDGCVAIFHYRLCSGIIFAAICIRLGISRAGGHRRRSF